MAENDVENEFLREELERVAHQLAILQAEDQGWLLLNGAGVNQENTGLSLQALQKAARMLREEVTASPLPKNANAVRYSYTFSQPFIIPGIQAGSINPKDVERRRGRPSKAEQDHTALMDFYNNEVNQRYVFGKAAQELLSTSCSTEGGYFLVGDETTKTCRPIPIHEITAVALNPDFPDEVWAYQRSWNPNPEKVNGDNVYWYYTDSYKGVRAKKMEDGNPVDPTKTVIDLKVGSQVGWTWGVPDLLAGQIWNRTYLTLINNGKAVSETLAYFAAKVRSRNPAAAQKASVRIASKGGAGSVHGVTEGNDIDVFSTAGKAYDFRGLQPVAELYAASVGIAATDLLASPAASGSSYGAATALAPGVRRGIEARRSQIAAWLERVIKWGAGVTLQVTPASIEDVDPYRRAQMFNLMWGTGLIHADEARDEALYLAGITPKHPNPPAGILVPNNEDSLPRKDIDTDGTGNPEKGKGGDSSLSNDIRQDTIS